MTKELNKQLLIEVKSLVNESKYSALASIKLLLEQGADPKNMFSGESAFDLVEKANKDGRYNSVIEEFENSKYPSLREEDGVDEGMPLKDEEF